MSSLGVLSFGSRCLLPASDFGAGGPLPFGFFVLCPIEFDEGLAAFAFLGA